MYRCTWRASAALRIACFLEAHDLLLLLDAEGAHDVLQLLIAPRNRSGLLDELGLFQLLHGLRIFLHGPTVLHLTERGALSEIGVRTVNP